MQTRVFGTPAVYARSLRTRARGKQAAAWVLGALGVVTAYAGVTSDPVSMALVVVGAVVLVLGVIVFNTAAGAVARTGSGIAAERTVAKVLNSTGFTAVIHGALLDAGGDADHVALGPVAVVVETKSGRGEVAYSAAAGMRAGRKKIPGDPVRQVRRQAAALAPRVGSFVHAVVCIPQMTGPAFQVGQGKTTVWVCSVRDLPTVVRSFPAVLPPAAALQVAETIRHA